MPILNDLPTSDGVINIPKKYQFKASGLIQCISKRDEYFTKHSKELVKGVTISLIPNDNTGVLQQYERTLDDIWDDISPLVEGPSGKDGADGKDGESSVVDTMTFVDNTLLLTQSAGDSLKVRIDTPTEDEKVILSKLKISKDTISLLSELPLVVKGAITTDEVKASSGTVHVGAQNIKGAGLGVVMGNSATGQYLEPIVQLVSIDSPSSPQMIWRDPKVQILGHTLGRDIVSSCVFTNLIDNDYSLFSYTFDLLEDVDNLQYGVQFVSDDLSGVLSRDQTEVYHQNFGSFVKGKHTVQLDPCVNIRFNPTGKNGIYYYMFWSDSIDKPLRIKGKSIGEPLPNVWMPNGVSLEHAEPNRSFEWRESVLKPIATQEFVTSAVEDGGYLTPRIIEQFEVDTGLYKVYKLNTEFTDSNLISITAHGLGSGVALESKQAVNQSDIPIAFYLELPSTLHYKTTLPSGGGFSTSMLSISKYFTTYTQKGDKGDRGYDGYDGTDGKAAENSVVSSLVFNSDSDTLTLNQSIGKPLSVRIPTETPYTTPYLHIEACEPFPCKAIKGAPIGIKGKFNFRQKNLENYKFWYTLPDGVPTYFSIDTSKPDTSFFLIQESYDYTEKPEYRDNGVSINLNWFDTRAIQYGYGEYFKADILPPTDIFILVEILGEQVLYLKEGEEFTLIAEALVEPEGTNVNFSWYLNDSTNSLSNTNTMTTSALTRGFEYTYTVIAYSDNREVAERSSVKVIVD